MPTNKVYKIKEDEYSAEFLQLLAMCTFLDIFEPAELEFWYDNKIDKYEMANLLTEKIKKARNS